MTIRKVTFVQLFKEVEIEFKRQFPIVRQNFIFGFSVTEGELYDYPSLESLTRSVICRILDDDLGDTYRDPITANNRMLQYWQRYGVFSKAFSDKKINDCYKRIVNSMVNFDIVVV